MVRNSVRAVVRYQQDVLEVCGRSEKSSHTTN